MVETNKIEDLLLKLIEDVAIVKSKLEALDDLKADSKNINDRVDKIEAMNERHEHSIKALENRANAMEQHVRNSMIDNKKQTSSLFISIGLAVFSVILNIVVSLF